MPFATGDNGQPDTDTGYSGHTGEPAYLDLFRSGELQRRAHYAIQQLSACGLCARYCHADRSGVTPTASCQTGRLARLASPADALNTAESPLGGPDSPGIIRFAGCSLSCQYCPHWQSSQQVDGGRELDAVALAQLMLERQDLGAPNINLVPATHLVAQILEALVIACEQGLRIPLVYNSGGYDALESLQLLDGVIDIYAIELKYGNNELARKYSGADNYVEYSHIAAREMYRQVGDLIVDADGIARRGLLVRHMVLPANQASTKKVLSFVSADISPDTYINLMDGYQPSYNARQFEKLNRPVTETEIRQAIRCGGRCGLHRMDLHMSKPWASI